MTAIGTDLCCKKQHVFFLTTRYKNSMSLRPELDSGRNDMFGTLYAEAVQKVRFPVIANCEERSRKQTRALIFNGLLRAIALAMTASMTFYTASTLGFLEKLYLLLLRKLFHNNLTVMNDFQEINTGRETRYID
jgi:hypothetical protein